MSEIEEYEKEQEDSEQQELVASKQFTNVIGKNNNYLILNCFMLISSIH